MRRFDGGSETVRLLALIFTVVLAMALLAGCSNDPGVSVSDAAVPPVVPSKPDLTTAQAAVRSYADWISYAYRILDSDTATQTFTPNEEVRVDAYVQYNLIEGRAIEQYLERSDYKRVKPSGEATVTLAGSEFWRYRYIDPARQSYTTGPLEASYDATYTVVRSSDGLWRVDSVEVVRRGEPEPQ